ncbi:MAG: ClpXP protease specificity-enhancing factor [Sulfurifustaceae bacterium]
MTPLKLYLLRAVYDWAIENALTPHLVVDASHPGVRVPAGYVQDGKVVLNVSPRATQALQLNADGVVFSARFGGKPYDIECPLPAVRALYARENGQGVAFPESDEGPPTTGPAAPPATPRKGPVLKRIK